MLTPAFVAVLIALTGVLYGASFGINLDYGDWTHRQQATGRGLISFFSEPQYDGFYRPLTFASLWIDDKVWGDRMWGYHLQSILLHALNGILVARVACRLGAASPWPQWAGLLFVALPAAFEAVIWPGARFDLLSTAFTLIALEAALAGSVLIYVAGYALGVLSKESAYCLPLILAALWLWHERLQLGVIRKQLLKTLVAVLGVTVVLIGIRFMIYGGNFGGYPDTQSGRVVHFLITPRTFTSLATRVVAALYLVNSSTPLTLWMKAGVCAFAIALVAAAALGARLGSRWPLIVLPFLAAAPTVNMIAWLNDSAQQARYVYQAGVWAIIATCFALVPVRLGKMIGSVLLLAMSTAALFNTSAYFRMLRAADETVEAASALCRSAQCCTLVLENLPRDLHGAFYFGHQVRRGAERALPDVKVTVSEPAADACTARFRWRQARKGPVAALDAQE